MTAKMPMSGSPEKRRDCIAQLPLRVAYFYAGDLQLELFFLTSVDMFPNSLNRRFEFHKYG
jgi:hypothetical protein